jgi:diadenylate cyclase
MNPLLARKLGTRHRAAIGITEEADCLALVVSEETGRISAAAFGEIDMDLSLKHVQERIAKHFGKKRPAEPIVGDDAPAPQQAVSPAKWKEAERP